MTKIATASELRQINWRSVVARYQNVLTTNQLETLDTGGTNVCSMHMLEGDGEIVRTKWLLKVAGTDEPVEAFLDMTPAQFASLNDSPNE